MNRKMIKAFVLISWIGIVPIVRAAEDLVVYYPPLVACMGGVFEEVDLLVSAIHDDSGDTIGFETALRKFKLVSCNTIEIREVRLRLNVDSSVEQRILNGGLFSVAHNREEDDPVTVRIQVGNYEFFRSISPSSAKNEESDDGFSSGVLLSRGAVPTFAQFLIRSSDKYRGPFLVFINNNGRVYQLDVASLVPDQLRLTDGEELIEINLGEFVRLSGAAEGVTIALSRVTTDFFDVQVSGNDLVLPK